MSIVRVPPLPRLSLSPRPADVARAPQIPAEAIARVKSNDETLKVLNLTGNPLYTSGADELTVTLAEALKTNTNLKELKLGNNNISVTGAVALAEALKVNSTLEKLELEGNKVRLTPLHSPVLSLRSAPRLAVCTSLTTRKKKKRLTTTVFRPSAPP